jgi:hypothetical protein
MKAVCADLRIVDRPVLNINVLEANAHRQRLTLLPTLHVYFQRLG